MEQQIEYYDSLGGVDHATISSLLRWVEDEYADKYKKPLPEKFQVCHPLALTRFHVHKMSSGAKESQHRVRCADQELDTGFESSRDSPAAQRP